QFEIHRAVLRLKHALVIERKNANKLTDHVIPPEQYLGGPTAARILRVLKDQVLDGFDLARVFYVCYRNHLRIAASDEVPCLIQHVRNPSRHAGGKVTAS